MFKKEPKMMRKIKHPNIVRCYGVRINFLTQHFWNNKVHKLYFQQFLASKKLNFKLKYALQITFLAQFSYKGCLVESHPPFKTIFYTLLTTHQMDEDLDYLYIELELMKGGDLYSDMKNRKRSKKLYEEEEVVQIMKCILQGLDHIHDQNIVHRDLKPANLLLKGDMTYTQVKIGDFGLSGQYEKNSIQKSLSKNVGTTLFMAPEQFLKQDYGKVSIFLSISENFFGKKSCLKMSQNVDMWSVGIIMWILLGDLHHPLYKKGMEQEEFKSIVLKGDFDFSNLKCSE